MKNKNNIETQVVGGEGSGQRKRILGHTRKRTPKTREGLSIPPGKNSPESLRGGGGGSPYTRRLRQIGVPFSGFWYINS